MTDLLTWNLKQGGTKKHLVLNGHYVALTYSTCFGCTQFCLFLVLGGYFGEGVFFDSWYVVVCYIKKDFFKETEGSEVTRATANRTVWEILLYFLF